MKGRTERQGGFQSAFEWKAGFVVRWVAIGTVILIAVAAGTYVGYALVIRSVPVTSEGMPTMSFLRTGDEFPNYELWDATSNLNVALRDVTRGQNTLIVFVSKNCGVCWTMMDYWGEKVIPELSPGIQLVWVFDHADWPPPDNRVDQLILPRSRIVTTNRSEQKIEDGIDLTPTVIGLDRDSEIRFVNYGFSRSLEASYINKSFEQRAGG